MLLLPVIATGLGIIATMSLVRIFPAKKTKEILLLLGILLLIGLYLLFRFLQPERLFNTEELNQFIHYLAIFNTPTNAYWPNHWFVEFLIPLLFEKPGAPFFNFLKVPKTGADYFFILFLVAGDSPAGTESLTEFFLSLQQSPDNGFGYFLVRIKQNPLPFGMLLIFFN